MHYIEPFYNWRDQYTAEEDERSPFYQREYSEFGFSNTIYDHYIHPQWDEIGSHTLYVKLLFADYEKKYAIIELLGEWNDCISNDIMYLKREVIDVLLAEGVNQFILIGENVLNFHFEGNDYYEEWFNDAEPGWIAAINFQPHVLEEWRKNNLDYYLSIGGIFDDMAWRPFQPEDFHTQVARQMNRRLPA